MPTGPRIYNLFPLLAGSMDHWHRHLPRIAGMGFDWIYVNPFHQPGFSGSLYAIQDIARLHPVIKGHAHQSPADLVTAFTATAGDHGIRVMADLVINHTAKDALLVDSHPDWFVRDEDGSLRSPRAVDPDDPEIVTIWGDLAEIDYHDPNLRTDQIAYWSAVVQAYLDQGISGFRCDAAYQVPADVWRPLIEVARQSRPDCLFFAETLGCTVEQVEGLAEAGFDFLFNSSKWWDFEAPWLLDQYDQFRSIAPSIGFPESHDTQRLAAELADADPVTTERTYRLRYLFAATFSTGLMMPIGYEYGFAESLHVVDSRPDHWDRQARRPRFDLTRFIAAVNEMKAGAPALNDEGPQHLISPEGANVVALLRLDGDSARHRVLTLINPDPQHPHSADLGTLDSGGVSLAGLSEITPEGGRTGLDETCRVTLGPLETRIYAG